MSDNNNQKAKKEDSIKEEFKDTNVIVQEFKYGEFYEKGLTGKIREAFCFVTKYPKYVDKPLYYIYEVEKELIDWFASDSNSEYLEEAEYAKIIVEWHKNMFK